MNAEALLLEELDGVIRGVVSRFFAPGLERDDLLQEARIAVLRAFRHDYQPELSSPATFAELVVKRHLIDIVKHHQRDRRRANVNAASLDWPSPTIIDDDECTLGDLVLQAPALERVADAKRDVARLIAGDGLSELEHRAAVGLAAGATYEEIAGDRSTKSVDNALRRAKLKLAA